ncbi:hypothetical protein P691DRAFT_813557 [Macrolepiota fuliginosa MF-IS2]|uniref:Uncharacterized protein n=1 Tax=Macrolepiota fuliginosa MF-IS2 TaxID=1400762 RepID=A0A9P6C2F0_9AGAR|nr:hypothetical protein P691DRAFT_813557 [Macrolepiota fuliginosa MF-IS2]
MSFPGYNTIFNPPLPRRRNAVLPVQPQESVISDELAVTEWARPVAQPRLTSGPADTRAVLPHTITISGRIRNINFVSHVQPATNPPVGRLWLTFPDRYVYPVRSAMGNGYVSVDDVQRAVIEWMTWQPQSNILSRREIISRQGTTVAVWVWVWRGLVQIGSDATRWSVELGFDV